MDDSSILSDIQFDQTRISIQRLLDDSEPDSPIPEPRKYLISTKQPNTLSLPPPRLVQPEETDDHVGLLKNLALRFEAQALEAFSASKAALTADLNAKLEAQHLELTATIKAVSEKKEQLENDLCSTKKLAKTRLNQLNGLVILFGKLRKALQQRVLLKTAVEAWKSHHRGTYELRVKTRLAAHLAKQRALSQVLGAWRAFAADEALDKKLEAVRAEVEATKEDEIRTFADERASFMKELEFLKLALKEERDNKDKFQENLKRLFQRNISSLNFEAMTLLTPNSQLAASPSPGFGSMTVGLLPELGSPPVNPYAQSMPVATRALTDSEHAHSLSGLPFVNYSAELNRSFADSDTPKSGRPRFQRFVPGTVVGRPNNK
jgi:hypothetical protein